MGVVSTRSSAAEVHNAIECMAGPYRLGYEPPRRSGLAGNADNASTPKTLTTEHRPMQLDDVARGESVEIAVDDDVEISWRIA